MHICLAGWLFPFLHAVDCICGVTMKYVGSTLQPYMHLFYVNYNQIELIIIQIAVLAHSLKL